MRLEIRTVHIGNRVTEMIFLVHGSDEIEWQMVERTKRDADLDIFEQINGYWADQPTSWQDSVFVLYANIREAMYDAADVQQLMRSLFTPVAELLDRHDVKHVHEWLNIRSAIRVPSSVPDEYNEEEGSRRTRSKTYTRDDYLSFATLSVTLRVVLPVWGEFMAITKRDVRASWKESFAYILISQAKLMHCPAMQRLHNYVESMVPADQDRADAILNGISSQDYNEWIMAITVVRRVAIADVRGLGDKNVIAYIFSYLAARTSSWNNSTAGGVQPKRNPENYGVDSESKLSRFEDYKIKQRTSAGDTEIIEHELTMPHRIAQAICKTLPMELLDASLVSVQALEDKEILSEQGAIASFVLARWIPARAVELFQKRSLMTAIAIAQAVLWHHKHYDIAALLSATEHDNQLERRAGVYGKQPSVPPELLAEIDRLYPFHKRVAQKSKTPKEKNNTIIRIEQLASAFKDEDWRLTLPAEWLPQVAENMVGRRYTAPADLKIKMIQLMIQIGSRAL